LRRSREETHNRSYPMAADDNELNLVRKERPKHAQRIE
jgi:hypothetical protein